MLSNIVWQTNRNPRLPLFGVAVVIWCGNDQVGFIESPRHDLSICGTEEHFCLKLDGLKKTADSASNKSFAHCKVYSSAPSSTGRQSRRAECAFTLLAVAAVQYPGSCAANPYTSTAADRLFVRGAHHLRYTGAPCNLVRIMDRGTWTFRCQMCDKDFEIEVKPGQRVIQYAQDAACPHCLNAPGAKMESNAYSLWHHIISFRPLRSDS